MEIFREACTEACRDISGEYVKRGGGAWRRKRYSELRNFKRWRSAE